MKSPYGQIAAEFYQLTKPLGAYYPDLEFYLPLFEGVKGKILEIGSGTGRFLLPFLKEGLDVEGLENNAYMNQWCLNNAKALKLKPILIEKDLRTWKAPKRRYAAIVFSFGSLQLFTDWTELVAILKALHGALNAGGKIYIDVDVTRMDLSRSGIKTHGAEIGCPDGSVILLEGSKSYDFVNQIESHHMRYEKWKNSKIVATELQNLQLRWMGVHELKLLLKEVGFQNVQHCFDYDSAQVESDGSSEVICFSAHT